MSTEDKHLKPADVSGVSRRAQASVWKVLLLTVLGLVAGYYLLLRVPRDPVPTAVAWQTDFDAASRQAQASSKVIFVDFTAGWCGYCRKMDQTVFSRQDFADALQEVAVPLRVDVESDTGAALTRRYDIEGIPAYRVLRPDGRQIGRGEGVATAESLLNLTRQAAHNAQATPTPSP